MQSFIIGIIIVIVIIIGVVIYFITKNKSSQETEKNKEREQILNGLRSELPDSKDIPSDQLECLVDKVDAEAVKSILEDIPKAADLTDKFIDSVRLFGDSAALCIEIYKWKNARKLVEEILQRTNYDADLVLKNMAPIYTYIEFEVFTKIILNTSITDIYNVVKYPYLADFYNVLTGLCMKTVTTIAPMTTYGITIPVLTTTPINFPTLPTSSTTTPKPGPFYTTHPPVNEITRIFKENFVPWARDQVMKMMVDSIIKLCPGSFQSKDALLYLLTINGMSQTTVLDINDSIEKVIMDDFNRSYESLYPYIYTPAQFSKLWVRYYDKQSIADIVKDMIARPTPRPASLPKEANPPHPCILDIFCDTYCKSKIYDAAEYKLNETITIVRNKFADDVNPIDSQYAQTIKQFIPSIPDINKDTLKQVSLKIYQRDIKNAYIQSNESLFTKLISIVNSGKVVSCEEYLSAVPEFYDYFRGIALGLICNPARKYVAERYLKPYTENTLATEIWLKVLNNVVNNPSSSGISTCSSIWPEYIFSELRGGSNDTVYFDNSRALAVKSQNEF